MPVHRSSRSTPLGIALLAACTMLSAPSAAPAAPTRLGLDAEYSHDTNVNRAALDGERRSDDAVSIEGYAARSFLLSARSGIVIKGAVRATEFFRYRDLSNIGASGRAAYRFQPSPGFTSPWIELAGRIEGFQYRDSSIRDGYAASASASVGKYFTDRIRLEAGAGIDRRGGEGSVYDLSDWKVWTALDYKLTGKTTLYGSATRLDGEQVFTLFNTAAWAPLYAYAKASAADPVFASAFGGAAPTAYRMDTQSNRYELGVNVALYSSHALDLGWSHFDSRADRGGGKYDGDIFRIGYLYRFR
jgi:hypothetical protein